MPDIWFDVDAAIGEAPVNILPLIDDTDFKSIEDNSVAYNATGLELIWHFVTCAGAFSSTVVTPTTGGRYDWAHQDGGVYTIEIPASGGASINNDTEGFGWFTGKATGVLPWRGPVIGFRASGLNDKMVESAYDTTRGLAGTALPAAAAEAAGGLYTRGTGAGQIAQDANGNVRVNLDTIKTQAITCGAGVTILASVGTAATSTAQTGDVYAIVNNGTYGNSALNTDLDTLLTRVAGTIAAGTHTAQSGDAYAIVNNGTYGNSALKTLIDDVPNTTEFNARTIAAADYLVTADLSGIATATNVTDAVSAIETYGDTKWLTATGFSTHSAADVKTAIEADGSKLDHLWEMTEDDGGVRRLTANALEEAPSTSGLDAAGVRTAIGLATANLDTQLTDIKGATFNSATDSLESIRNQGDTAWKKGNSIIA